MSARHSWSSFIRLPFQFQFRVVDGDEPCDELHVSRLVHLHALQRLRELRLGERGAGHLLRLGTGPFQLLDALPRRRVQRLGENRAAGCKLSMLSVR